MRGNINKLFVYSFFILLGVYSSQGSGAELRTCSSPLPVFFQAEKDTKIPLNDFNEILLSTGSGDDQSKLIKGSGKNEYVLTDEDLKIIGNLGEGKTAYIKYIHSDPSKSCQMQLSPPVSKGRTEEANAASNSNSAGSTTSPNLSTAKVDLSNCQEFSWDYYDKIKEKQGATNFSLVVFCGADSVYQESHGRRDGGVWGDRVYVVLYDTTSITNIRFEFPNCAAEAAGPRGYTSGSFPLGGLQTTNKLGVPTTITPELNSERQGIFRQCYNDSVDVVLKGQKHGGNIVEELGRYNLRQAQPYHFTTQVGVIFTDDVTHDYVVTDDGSGTKRIRDTGPSGDGPRYYASVVLYGLPHQLRSLVSGNPYRGRALQFDNSFSDRLGFLLGVGLKDPGDEFVAGIALEIMTGINLTWANRWAKIETLDGVSVGDTFSGTTETLPKKKRWEQDWAFGLAIDLRYVTSLFDRK